MRASVLTCGRAHPGPNMTPLVDVVMVILIFLMLAGSFAGAEHYLASTTAIQGKVDGAPPFEDVQIDIRIDGGLQAGDPNRWTARFGDLTTSDTHTLCTGLSKLRANYEARGTAVDHLQVIINPNRFVKWNALLNIYQAALEAKFTRVAFSTAH